MTPSSSEIETPSASVSGTLSDDLVSETTTTHVSSKATQELEVAEPAYTTTPQLFSSPPSTYDTPKASTLTETTDKDGAVITSPSLPNGEARLHPLLDELHSAATGSDESSSEGANIEHNSALMDAMAQDAITQFPSPSSGFVPPVTREDFTLSKVPIAKSKQSNREGIEQQATTTGDETEQHDEIPSINTLAGTTDSSIQPEVSKGLPAQTLTSILSIPRRFSTSSSSSSIGDNHSQAISARSSPSTVAPQRRRSSASPVLASQHSQFDIDEARYMIPLKIRDFAFTELDPRHVGARDVSAPGPQLHLQDDERGFRSGRLDSETEEDDEEEEEETAFQGQGLPTGLYHAAYDFAAESEHELSVQVGQKLRLIGHVDGGWAIVIRVKEGEDDVAIPEDENSPDVDKGLVPEAYLEWLG